VELNVYNGLPHLLCPVITDPRQAAQGLKNIIKEMEQRYSLFAEAGARDMQRYNEFVLERGEKPLPNVIVIIDELADLMITSPADVEDSICRIAQKSRAAGIHLLVATQRPSVDVITGIIKANLTTRIAFAVSSAADSKTILDMGGAEKLLGRGDMLFFPMGASKPLRLQSAYISDEEVENVVAHILAQSVPMLRTDFLQPHEDDAEEEILEIDELLPEAARMVVESGQASISMLQRRLRIGYTRAGRLIDDMERLSIVGGHEGSKARKILVTLPQLEEILENLNLSTP
ncbi:MAG TPA: FtsK/SpoIIIE domain-containing protein, partial [Bacillota bacterium]|nr:FtsK/SpoIIIE domain-containing protein [Bacillota bacterium]